MEWISVEDKLPERGVCVLVAEQCYSETQIGWLSMLDGKSWSVIDHLSIDRDVYEKVAVTHWMPLPAPPKED